MWGTCYGSEKPPFRAGKQTYEPDGKYKRDVDINLSLPVCDVEPINQGLQMELVDC